MCQVNVKIDFGKLLRAVVFLNGILIRYGHSLERTYKFEIKTLMYLTHP